jgi:peroxiredoxin Q/BCP
VEDHLMQMKAVFKVGLAAALSLVSTTLGRAQEPVALKVGDMAPAFSAPGSDGKTHTLAESMGKRAVVLAWFPKAFTAG